MASLSLEGVSRRFGPTTAVDRVSLDVADGSFVALLGPSGCGKTTLLRLIAGFEAADDGLIRIGGDDVTGLAPEARDLGMVFQSYALWPHMTVAENVGFAKALWTLPKAEAAARVGAALDLVGLADYGRRRPAELSGGQRQRVALARCFAKRPRVVLLDEPLANLDAHLREAMLVEFRRFHRETGATFVYVTHDQAEAMSLADRIAVMNGGRLEQVAAPERLYAEPATAMVARFVGAGQLVPVTVMGRAGPGRLAADLWGHQVELRGADIAGPATACLRPRDLVLADGPGAISARLAFSTYQGGFWHLELVPDADASQRLRLESDRPPPAPGSRLGLALRDGWVLPGR
jgi:iron(III) transport system ATP-binding protein